MSRLERRYRLLLRAYPDGYRADYGDELLDVLLTTAEPDRALPPLREAAALVKGGIRTRILQSAHGPAWADGLHLAVTVLSLLNLAVLIPYASSVPLWVGVAAAVFLATLLGRVRLAIPLAALLSVKTLAITLARPWLDETLLPVFPDRPWQSTPALYASGGPIAPAVANGLLILGLVALAIRGETLHRRSWWWLAAVPVAAGADPAWRDIVEATPSAMLRVGLETALLLAACYAGHVTADHRWSIAAALHTLHSTVVLAESFTLVVVARQESAHWALVLLLTLVAAVLPFRARRNVLL
ncbi:hypothetical protein ACIBHY_21285 [Nonomuraea sp. NPDC050547]|uniref:hypothetical protein n=1 Tax=Nonomuraea sp. NPDC050547 TaxID=3364368 RepID=UPI0037B9BCCA